MLVVPSLLMRLIRSPAAMARWSRTLQRDGVLIGFVPTMGALHDGHRALIRRARLTCDAVVVSVFVNPLQFGPREDFARYPRPFQRDLAVCRAEDVDCVFAPAKAALYPEGFQTTVVVRNVSRRWEGAARPTHFTGVGTVVTILLDIVQPAVLFLGQKDFQQAVLITRLARDLHMPTRVVIHPTVREPDGLALSSRNVYLSPSQRQLAPILFQALTEGAAAIRDGVRDARAVHRLMKRRLAATPGIEIDYLGVCDPLSLEPLQRVAGSAVLLCAIRIGRVRLIDNVLIGGPRRSGAGRAPAR